MGFKPRLVPPSPITLTAEESAEIRRIFDNVDVGGEMSECSCYHKGYTQCPIHAPITVANNIAAGQGRRQQEQTELLLKILAAVESIKPTYVAIPTWPGNWEAVRDSIVEAIAAVADADPAVGTVQELMIEVARQWHP